MALGTFILGDYLLIRTMTCQFIFLDLQRGEICSNNPFSFYNPQGSRIEPETVARASNFRFNDARNAIYFSMERQAYSFLLNDVIEDRPYKINLKRVDNPAEIPQKDLDFKVLEERDWGKFPDNYL